MYILTCDVYFLCTGVDCVCAFFFCVLRLHAAAEAPSGHCFAYSTGIFVYPFERCEWVCVVFSFFFGGFPSNAPRLTEEPVSYFRRSSKFTQLTMRNFDYVRAAKANAELV